LTMTTLGVTAGEIRGLNSGAADLTTILIAGNVRDFAMAITGVDGRNMNPDLT